MAQRILSLPPSVRGVPTADICALTVAAIEEVEGGDDNVFRKEHSEALKGVLTHCKKDALNGYLATSFN